MCHRDIFSMERKKVMNKWEKTWKNSKEDLNVLARTYLNFVRSHIEKILEDIPKKTNSIDVGCGTGRSMQWLKEFGFNPIGIDCSKSAVNRCKSLGLDVLLADAYKTTFKDREFDLVVSAGVIEHFKDFQPIIDEMCRISKKYILLVQPNRSSLYRKLANIYYLFIPEKGPPELDYELEDFLESLSRNGFYLSKSSITPLDGYWVLLFKKMKSEGIASQSTIQTKMHS